MGEAVLFRDPTDNHVYAGEVVEEYNDGTTTVKRNGNYQPVTVDSNQIQRRGKSASGRLLGTLKRSVVDRNTSRAANAAALGARGAAAAAIGTANYIEDKTHIGRKTKNVAKSAAQTASYVADKVGEAANKVGTFANEKVFKPVGNELYNIASEIEQQTGIGKGTKYLARGTAMAGNRLLLQPGAALARGTRKAFTQGATMTVDQGKKAFQAINSLTDKKRGQYRPIQTAVLPGLGNCRWVGMFPPPDTFRVGGNARTRRQQLNRRTRKENGRRTQSRRQRLQSSRTTRLI
jgi:hypothetical protein